MTWDTGPNGDPRAALEVHDTRSEGGFARAALLIIELRGPSATYVVEQANNRTPPKKFAALATALRELRKVVIRASKLFDCTAKAPAQPPNRPATLEESGQFRQAYTADQAAQQPVIRAAIIVGYEVQRVKGEAPLPAELLVLANKALEVLDLMAPPGQPEGVSDCWVERALVGMLTGALLAA